MGTWGPRTFENDVALDFAGEIRTAQDLADALTIRSVDQPIDADTACRIVGYPSTTSIRPNVMQ